MTNQALDEILLRGTDELRALLETAFEAGRTSEREAMKRRMEQFFENVNHWTEVHNKIVPPKPEQPRPEGRAPLGSVKPAIKSLIEKAEGGISAGDIVKQTGFKENSVRGTLSALKTERFAPRNGELWFAIRQGHADDCNDSDAWASR